MKELTPNLKWALALIEKYRPDDYEEVVCILREWGIQL